MLPAQWLAGQLWDRNVKLVTRCYKWGACYGGWQDILPAADMLCFAAALSRFTDGRSWPIWYVSCHAEHKKVHTAGLLAVKTEHSHYYHLHRGLQYARCFCYCRAAHLRFCSAPSPTAALHETHSMVLACPDSVAEDTARKQQTQDAHEARALYLLHCQREWG